MSNVNRDVANVTLSALDMLEKTVRICVAVSNCSGDHTGVAKLSFISLIRFVVVVDDDDERGRVA